MSGGAGPAGTGPVGRPAGTGPLGKPAGRGPAGAPVAAAGERPTDVDPEGADLDPAGDTALVRAIIGYLRDQRRTLAVAESLTGGLVAAAITSVPGASAVFRGGIVAYATDLKAVLLGVPVTLLDEHGAVHEEVAMAMAEGVRGRLEADVGFATTGVAGPDPADGRPPGTVHVAVATPGGRISRTLALAGDRDQVRRVTVTEALRLGLGVLGEDWA